MTNLAPLIKKCCQPDYVFNLNVTGGIYRASVYRMESGIICGPDAKTALGAVEGLIAELETSKRI